MDTFSHGAWTYLILKNHPKRWLVVWGMVFPDIAILGLGSFLLLKGNLHVFKPLLQQLYSVPLVPFIDTAFHSLIIWIILFLVFFINHFVNAKWFFFGVFSHIGIDILTHKHFIPRYLWPISDTSISGLIDYRTLLFMAIDILLLLSFTFWSIKKLINIKNDLH
ncbi:MAG: hypothetical protein CVU89_03190 [Firmicutes bacterium HGW-Firmicutes-14]|jgi:hypothetical protein|nr:MAG: hypothetical protein CVU89_03190 [Firmicutes bacterium HGW-Firmicutes-14]